MTPHGKFWHDKAKGMWFIQTQPHIVIKLKALFTRIKREFESTLTITHSPSTAADLNWFLLRYPHEMSESDKAFLASETARHEAFVSQMQLLHQAAYVPKAYNLSHPLRNYQAMAADLCQASGRLLLADDVGLGKSAVAISLASNPDLLPLLVVCQAHLPKQWKKEIEKFIPQAKVHILKKSKPYNLPEHDVLISTYHKLHGWADTLARSVKAVAFDEIQELRIPTSRKYDAAKQLAETSRVKIGLSATPIGNYGGEMFHVLEMVAPGALGTLEEFHREWCETWGMHWRLRDPDAFGSFLKSESIMLRRTRRDVGRELPPVQRIMHTVEHSPEVIEKISGDATELARLVLEGSFEESGQSARLLDSVLRQATGIAKAPYVAQFVRLLVEDGEKVLLAGWHREVFNIWNNHLADLKPVMYTGSESAAAKMKSFDAFTAGDSPVLIISNRSGSGLNGLESACSVGVQGELDWSPSVMEQLIGRLNRDGMDTGKHVTWFYLLSDGGCDPIMSEIIGLKRWEAFHTLNPGESGTELDKIQVEGDRIKQLARSFLDRHKKKATTA